MTLSLTPPTDSQASSSLRLGSVGWPVFALQSGFNDAAGGSLIVDGSFGPKTLDAVEDIQSGANVKLDGIYGPATRTALCWRVYKRLNRDLPALPDRLAHNLGSNEGGNNPGAVNLGVPGGFDGGLFQLRCYGPPYVREIFERSFSPYRSGYYALGVILKKSRDWARPNLLCPFTGMDLAVLHHNWQWAAQQYFSYGRLPNPTKKCGTDDVIGYDRYGKKIYGWVSMSLPASARTYEGWARYYILKMTDGI